MIRRQFLLPAYNDWKINFQLKSSKMLPILGSGLAKWTFEKQNSKQMKSSMTYPFTHRDDYKPMRDSM